MELLEITSVPVIVSITYGVLALYKHFVKAEKWIKIIPILAAVLGAGLGVAAFYITPEIIPAGNVFVALLIGGASGLAATGTNQIFKQLTKDE